MVPAKSEKNRLHSLLSTNLQKLTITLPTPSTNTNTTDFDFSDVFGTPQPPPTTNAPPPSWEPAVIHNRSHSFVGPSPRYTTTPPPLPFHIQEEDEEEEIEIGIEIELEIEPKKTNSSSSSSSSGKLGPGDFEIMRVVGRGAFGKVFQVRMKRKSENGDGDGIYAMKVMRKDGIIKKKHVDYMKAERNILTKVIHPFIVRLRFSFQVSVTWMTSYCLRALCYLDQDIHCPLDFPYPTPSSL